MNRLGVYIVPVSEVFPDMSSTFETFKSLLRTLSLTDTLFWCARLNSIISSPHEETSDLEMQRSCIKQLLSEEEIKRIDFFAKQHGGASKVGVFFRGQLLELIRWAALICRDLPGDGTTHEDPEVRRRFAQAALIAGDVWGRRVFKDLDQGISASIQRALGAFRKRLEASMPAANLYRSLGRGWSFFNNYFSHHYAQFLNEFDSVTGLSLEEYYVCHTSLMVNFMGPTSEHNIFNEDLRGLSEAYKHIFRKRYLPIEAQTNDELRTALAGQISREIESDAETSPYDYKPLREKPILSTTDGRAIILDPVFYSEKAMVGPLFVLASRKPGSEANPLFTAFGMAFEDYTCDILRRMFPDLPGSSNKRLELQIKKRDMRGREFDVDACLNDVFKATVFEMKAVWLREDQIMSDDPETYLRHIREKYVRDSSGGMDKQKGISQLARTISLIASPEWTKRNPEFSRVELVYPVLVVYDQLLSAPAYSEYLGIEFRKLLKPERELCPGQMIKGNLRIAPLIVLTIEDLENLEESIKEFSFGELIEDYSQAHPDRAVSLYNFLATSSKYSNKMRHNQALSKKGLELLERSKRAYSDYQEPGCRRADD